MAIAIFTDAKLDAIFCRDEVVTNCGDVVEAWNCYKRDAVFAAIAD